MSDKELQNEEFILKGNLGTIGDRVVRSVHKMKDGSTTITVSPSKKWINPPLTETEDADFEIIQPKQLPPPELNQLK